jgi:fructose 1,6-bisphosphate aldolase/phosphatase
MKTTISVIKADIGSYPGHTRSHPETLKRAMELMDRAKKSGDITDYCVTNCGDDLELIMSHTKGVDDSTVNALAWKVFEECTEIAKRLKLYGAGQDMLKESFSGNVRGMGPGIAEMEFTERAGEPVLVFMMDKTEPGAFNFPVFKAFSDPFNTAGLVIDPALISGFSFEVWDVKEHKKVVLDSPEEMYYLLALIGAKDRYVIKRVFPRGTKLPVDEPVAVVSTEKLAQIAHKYVGKDDPVAIVRAQSGLPAVGEVLEPYSFPFLVSGWMRGSHNGPIMPVSQRYAQCTRFDGPPRVLCFGFQVNEGKLVGPVDMFDDPVYDNVREECTKVADYMRRHGPFEPHRLSLEHMEYTTLPQVLEKLKERFSGV